MRPSKALTIGSSCGHRLRLLDLRDDRDPATDLVHDLVDELDVVRRAHERQRDQVDAEVRARSAGRRRPFRTVPARSPRRWAATTPLLLETSTALGDQAGDVAIDHLTTSTATLPSSMSSRSPARTSVGKPLVRAGHPVVVTQHVIAGDDDGLAVGPLARGRRRTGRGGSSVPAGRPGCRRGARPPSRPRRTQLYRCRCSACSPWLKFSRATSMPAATSSRIRSGPSTAGPRVHTIFARRFTSIRVAASLGPLGGRPATPSSGNTNERPAARPRESRAPAVHRHRPGSGESPRPRPVPPRSPTRSATHRGACRRRQRRREPRSASPDRSHHPARGAAQADLAEQGTFLGAVESDGQQHHVGRQFAFGPGQYCDLALPFVLRTSTSAIRIARTLPSASETNSCTATAKARSPPSSWAG